MLKNTFQLILVLLKKNLEELKCSLEVQNPRVKKRFIHLVLQKKKWLKNFNRIQIQSQMFLIMTSCPHRRQAKRLKTLWYLMKKTINSIFQILLRVQLTFVVLVRFVILVRFKEIWIQELVVWRIKQVKNNQLRNKNLKKVKLKMETLKVTRTLEHVVNLVVPVLFFEDNDFHLVYK